MTSRRGFLGRVVALALPAGFVDHAGSSRDGALVGRVDPGSGWEGAINVRDHGAVGDGRTDDATAIERAVAAGQNVLFPPGRYRIARDLALQEKLILPKGALLAPDTGVRVGVHGPLDAGLYQVFGTDGSISLRHGFAVAYPQWWGARGDGEHDDTAALEAAFRARKVQLPAGQYRTTRELVAPNGLRLEGMGSLWNPQRARDSWIYYDGAVDPEAAVLRASTKAVGVEPDAALSNVVVRGVVLDGNAKAGYGLYAAYCSDESAFSDVTVIRTTRHGLWANKLWYVRFEHITARANLGCGITIGQRRPGWSRHSIPNGIYVTNLRAHSNGGDQAYHERSNPEWGYGIGFFPGNAVVLRNAVSEQNFGPGIIFGLGGGTANSIDGFYVEANGVEARRMGRAGRNWGLVVLAHANASGNEIARGRLGGSVGRANAQSIWLAGKQPKGTLILKDISSGQYLRADWSNYSLDGTIYYGLSNYIQGHEPGDG